MREWADFKLDDGPDGGSTLALSGPLRVYSIGDLDRRLDAQRVDFKRIDLSRVTDMDTTGAWLVWRLSQDHDADIEGANENADRMFKAIGRTDSEHVSPPEKPPRLVKLFGG